MDIMHTLAPAVGFLQHRKAAINGKRNSCGFRVSVTAGTLNYYSAFTETKTFANKIDLLPCFGIFNTVN
jgi:hypothetical protein